MDTKTYIDAVNKLLSSINCGEPELVEFLKNASAEYETVGFSDVLKWYYFKTDTARTLEDGRQWTPDSLLAVSSRNELDARLGIMSQFGDDGWECFSFGGINLGEYNLVPL